MYLKNRKQNCCKLSNKNIFEKKCLQMLKNLGKIFKMLQQSSLKFKIWQNIKSFKESNLKAKKV